MKAVSVIIPVYNIKEYLDECITSVVNQTLNDLDIILVDDGSTDGSQLICEDYAKKYDNVRVIHKENGGQGSARNVGLDNVVGKYIYFIDGDDYIKCDALEKLYRISEEAELDVALFSAESFSDDKGIQYNPDEYNRTKCLGEVLSGKDLFVRSVDAKEYYVSIPLMFYRAGYLLEKKYRFPEHIIHEDEIYAYLSLIHADKAMCISNKFYRRRYRAGSTMTGKKAYDSSMGYIYTWMQIMLSLNELNGWDNSEIERAISIANGRLGIAIRLYSNNSDWKERKEIRSRVKKMRKVVTDVGLNVKEYKNIKRFLANPEVYRVAFKMNRMRVNVQNLLLRKNI